MPRKLKVAMIGCGDVAPLYLEGARETKYVEFVKVMDVHLEYARRLGEEFGKPYTISYNEILNDEKIDAVNISVPHHLHSPLTVQAAKAGKHVLCDKPISTDVASAGQMINVCRRYGVKLALNYPLRFTDQAKKAKKIFDANIIGELFFVKIDVLQDKPLSYWRHGWRDRVTSDWRGSKEKSGGGNLLMNGSHYIDLVCYLTGLKPRYALGQCGTFIAPVEVEDLACGILRCTNGAIIQIASGSSMLGGDGEPMRIYGKKGQVVLSNPIQVYRLGRRKGTWQNIKFELEKNTYSQYLDMTAKAILSGKEPPVTGEDGLRVLKAIRAIYESSEKNKVVKIS